MENQLIELKIRNQELEKENTALKSKMSLMYTNWQFDFERFTLLKEKCKSGFCKNDNIENDEWSFRKGTIPASPK